MAAAIYPDIDNQMKRHRELFDIVSELSARSVCNIIEGDAIGLLNNWFIDHVRNDDIAFCRFLAKGKSCSENAAL